MLVRSYSKHLLIESLAAIRYFGGQCPFNSPVVNELNHALRIIGTNLESTFSKVVLKCIVLKPYTCQYFQVKHCNDLGISADKSSTLYLFIGIFATVGRLGGGFLCNIKSVKAIRLFQVAAFIVGTSTMLLTLTKTYGALVAYAIVFSLADGIMVTTYIIAVLNSVKEALRASTFGFSMMCAGVGALSSPPLSGRSMSYIPN